MSEEPDYVLTDDEVARMRREAEDWLDIWGPSPQRFADPATDRDIGRELAGYVLRLVGEVERVRGASSGG